MGNLFRADSATSPQVNFSADLRRYSISGKSLPENAAEFFDPILIWLKNLEETILRKTREGMLINEQHTFVFDFQYYNSVSGKYIYQFIEDIDRINTKIAAIQEESVFKMEMAIVWFYGEDDEMMKEAGEEMQDFTELEIEVKLR